MTTTATKTLHQNKNLGNGDYFVIISSSSHPLLLTEHAANGLVEAPLKEIQDLQCGIVVVKTLNMEISRCHLADYVKILYISVCRTCSAISFSSFNKSDFFLVSSFPLPLSLLTLPNNICQNIT